MSIPQQFLDEVRHRVAISGLISRSGVKLVKAGREYKACCPFHNEKSPSFTVVDDKGWAHCFGCGWHGDVFRWLADRDGTPFLEAVALLSAQAGLAMPAPSPEAAQHAAQVETVRGALDAAQAVYAAQLDQAGAVMEYLSGRGVTPDDIARFGIGYARAGDGSLKGRGIGTKLALAAGLLARREDNSLREVFHDRITVPIHDGRGRLVGFGGRVWPGRRGDTPKFVNSPQSEIFDKGRLLFNLHRASPAARPQAENRVISVEGYLDVVSLARVGIDAAVAPMGTALTEAQLQRLWRMHHRPILLFDGDPAGRKAAVRACRIALPYLAPGHELAVALLPDGQDPDDVARLPDGRDQVEAALGRAAPAHEFLFDAVMRGEV